MPSHPTRRWPRPAAWLVVLALHLLAVAPLLRLGAWRDRVPLAKPSAPLVVTLLDGRPATATAATAATAPPAVTRVRQPAAARPSPLAPAAPDAPALPSMPDRPVTNPQAITLPAPDQPPVAMPPAAQASAPPPPLNLALPRAASAPWRTRNPALDDLRANTPRATLESRISAAVGGVGGQVVEERLEDGTIRMRRGTSCVLAHPSRAAGIDPFNEAVSPKLRGVERC